MCQLNPVKTTAIYFISYYFVQLQVRAIRLAHHMYFYFITFRVSDRKNRKRKQFKYRPFLLLSRDFVYTELRPKVLGWREEKYIKMNLSEIDSKSDFLKTECNVQDD
jgi:hypothetical protein